MPEPARAEVTALLRDLRADEGDPTAVRDRLYTVLYEQLRALAGNLMRGERTGHTLQPTALVNEAFLKLVGWSEWEWQDRSHFLAVAARAMRQVLVDHARARTAEKRGGHVPRLTFEEATAPRSDPAVEVLEVERALDRLAALSDRMAQVVELRIFGGMTHEEIAEFLSISRRTVAGDWSVGRRFLRRELLGGGG
jgi:RNA polymerase sigma factor (TIGR02999 family)